MLTDAQLQALNPWWTRPDWAASDPHLITAAAAPFTWRPQPFQPEDLDSGGLFTLRGPRQSGKTTSLKRLAEQRTSAGARRTCYLSLQTVIDADDLVDAIQRILRLWPEAAGRWLFLLDEVTFVPGWARGVMFLRDTVLEFRDATVVVTGSSAADLAASASILAGRRGRIDRPLDRLHLPMSFREFVLATDPAIAPKTIIEADGFATVSPSLLAEASLDAQALDDRLAAFLACGGFPRSVSDMVTLGSVSDGTMEEAWRLVVSDVMRLGRSESTTQKLLARAVVSLGSLTNWTDLAGELDVSPQTAGQYTDLLAASFVLLVLHQMDTKRQAGPSLRSRRKLYLVDPLYAWIAARQGGPAPTTAALVETVIAVALYRAIERAAVERFAVPTSLFLWRSSNDREVDFVVDRGRRLAIESKYSSTITGKDRESLVKGFGGGIVVSRSTLDVDGPVRVIPAGVFLASLPA